MLETLEASIRLGKFAERSRFYLQYLKEFLEMPSLTVNDFEGESYEEMLENCFKAFTPRQHARLEALKARSQVDLKEWPAIYLERREYFQWVHADPKHEELHEEIQVMEARNKAERDAKKEANIQKGKALAKRPLTVTSKEIPPGSEEPKPKAPKVLGKR